VIAGDCKCLVGWDDADLFPVRVDDSDFFCSDVLIDPCPVRTIGPVCSSWKNYTYTSLSGLTGNGAILKILNDKDSRPENIL